MFSKLRQLSSFSLKDKKVIDLSAIKEDLFSGLFNVLETAFEQRQSDPDNSNFTAAEIDTIIQHYAKRNAMLAAASSIVPGPLGILGSIPELLLNFGNQMNMIYDLGCAYGKEQFINKDVLIDIPIAAFGGNTNLSSIQNHRIDLQDSPDQILLNKVSQLGESIIEKTLKKSVIQFIPVAGPILMSIWAKKTTSKISKGAISFLDSKEQYVEHFKAEESEATTKALRIEKIKALANLIESNNEINENQIELIGKIIENSGMNDEQKAFYLEAALKTGSNFQLNYQLLKDYEEDEDLVMDLVIMAKRSGMVDELEKQYIYQVGNDLQLDKPFLDELF